jgi:TIR domain-containing protein/uncharacterized protein DUF4062
MSSTVQERKIFISCFEEEFRRERKLLERTLEEHGHLLPSFEAIGGAADYVVKAGLKPIEECDIFVGIYGAFHGGMVPTSNPPFQTDYSYLELEFRTADESGKPILAFLQRVQWRDQELSRLLPLIVKRHKAYWFNTGNDLVDSVLDHIDRLFRSEEDDVRLAMLESEPIIQPKVFLSYAREDSQDAQRLSTDLRKAGIDVWFDKESLLPGQKWKPAINRAIKESRFFIALLSNTSVNKKGFVQKELKKAIEQLDEYPESAVSLIPVRIQDCNPAEERLLELQWVDMFPDWENGVSQIVKAIKSQASGLAE